MKEPQKKKTMKKKMETTSREKTKKDKIYFEIYRGEMG